MVPKFKFEGVKPAFINGGLRAFVQTVLPTIYDDSLSYYELLNKVVKHLNNVVADVATLNDNQENFIAAVTNFINTYGIETYDIDITNYPLDSSQLQLSEDAATALFEAVENDKIVRVFVHNSLTGTVYTCYYSTLDISYVSPNNNKNDLYFAGFSFRQLDTNATVIPWKIVKIERNGKITIYDSVNAVTKSYVDDTVQNAANALGRRIDGIENKTPYRVMFDVYPNPDTPREYIVASDVTPVSIGMLHDAGRDIECYMVEKSSADGIVIKTVKADTVVFGQGKVIISFEDMPYNASETDSTIYKKGYAVIYGNTTENVWTYQVSGKVTGRIDFNIEVLEGNVVNLVSHSHTPAEVYRLYHEYNGFVPCCVYLNTSVTGAGVEVILHKQINAVVDVSNITDGYAVTIIFQDIVNGNDALTISHYTIQGFSNTPTSWNDARLRVYEYPTAKEPLVATLDMSTMKLNLTNKALADAWNARKEIFIMVDLGTHAYAAKVVGYDKTNNLAYGSAIAQIVDRSANTLTVFATARSDNADELASVDAWTYTLTPV